MTSGTPGDKILILGSSGYVGSKLAGSFEFGNQNTYTCSRLKPTPKPPYRGQHYYIRDLEDFTSIQMLIEKIKPMIVINSIAEADVGKCELFPRNAERVNSEFPKKLAILSKRHEFKLVHFSTDAVFGQEGEYFSEEVQPIPSSKYGKTKLQGENEILDGAHHSLILRIRPFGPDSKKRNLFDYFCQNLLLNNKIPGFSNVFFSPMAVSHLPSIVSRLLQLNSTGIYHVGGSERISKHEFGKSIARKLKVDENLVTKKIFSVKNSDRTKFDSSLNSYKLIKELSLKFSLDEDLNVELENMRMQDAK